MAMASFGFTAEIFALFIIFFTESISLVSHVFNTAFGARKFPNNPLNINNHASFRFRYPALLDTTIIFSHSMFCKLMLSPFSMTCCHLEFVCI